MEEKELKELLMKENEEFKEICELHQQYEDELGLFKQKGFLTEVERLKERELKKKKLALKDRMYFMMTEYSKSLQ